MSLAFRHIRTRILAVFLLLLSGVLGAVLLAVYFASLNNARIRAEESFRISGASFARHVADRSESLVKAVRMLAGDAGLKSALIGGDLPTAESALANHAQRFGAEVSMLVTREGVQLINTLSPGSFGQAFPCRHMLETAELKGGSAGYVHIGDHTYQMVLTPMAAADGEPVAWLALGFLIRDADASALQVIEGVGVNLLSMGEQGANLVASSQTGALRGQIQTWVEGLAGLDDQIRVIRLGGQEYWVHFVRLDSASALDYAVALTLSVDEALSTYKALGTTLVIISLLALLAFLLGANLISRRLTRPILSLVEGVGAVARGDYAARVASTERDELGTLAQGFNQMAGEIQERQAQIEFLAYHDLLTGMPNRTHFVSEVEKARLVPHARGVLIFASLARLKNINFSLGFEVGDVLLQSLAQRVLARHDWISARLGGDKFAFFCPLTGAGDQADADDWEVHVRAALEVPVDLNGQRYDLGVHLGSARFPEDGDTAELLLRRAELAMRRGMTTVGAHVPYQAAFDAGGVRRLALLNDLRGALEDGQLFPCYQPKARIADGRVVACEFLMRWRHPVHGLVFPDDFIPAAEQSTLIQPLTRWVIETAAAQAARWRDQGRQIAVGVNLSARNLVDHEVVDVLAGALARHALPADTLIAEITESALMDDPETAISVVNAIGALGVKLSIDDFGTGYSSLSQLSRLSVDELKIDKAFVFRMLESAPEAAIVLSTIELAHTLGMTVVAEGVETGEHWKRLAEFRCDIAQGYLLAKPLEIAAFDAWLAEREGAAGSPGANAP